MPFWKIYHSDSIFKDASTKKPLSEDITKMYQESPGLPAFYVVVVFIPLPSDSFFVGGEERDNPFVRISIDHIAVNMNPDVKVYKGFTSKVDQVLEPHIGSKGWDWEYHVNETERMLWKVNGIYAPPFKSEEEKKWVKYNRIFEREEEEEVVSEDKLGPGVKKPIV